MLRLVARLWLHGGKRLLSARAGLPDVAPWWEAAVQCACWSAGRGSVVGNACSVRCWSAGHGSAVGNACSVRVLVCRPWLRGGKRSSRARARDSMSPGSPIRSSGRRPQSPKVARRWETVTPRADLTSGCRRGVTNGSPDDPHSQDDPHEPSDPTRAAARPEQPGRPERAAATGNGQRPPDGAAPASRVSAAGAVRRGGAEGVRGRIRQPPATRPAVPGVGHRPGVAETDRGLGDGAQGLGAQPAVRACRPSWPGGRTRRSGPVSGTGPGTWSGSAPPSSVRRRGSAGPGPAPRWRCRRR